MDNDVSFKALQMKSAWIGDKPVPKPVYFVRMVKSYYELGCGKKERLIVRFARALLAAYNSACTVGPQWLWWLKP